MKIIVGLGNPDKAYDNTRHNIGFEIIDEIARRFAVRFRRSWRHRAWVAKIKLGTEVVWLVKPRTYMNHSGKTVASFLRKREVSPSDFTLIYDDIDLELGRIRVRGSGSSGSHNGVKSVLAATQDKAVPRIRVGVGRPPKGIRLVDFVLAEFEPDERVAVQKMVLSSAEAAESIVVDGVVLAQNKYNS